MSDRCHTLQIKVHHSDATRFIEAVNKCDDFIWQGDEDEPAEKVDFGPSDSNPDIIVLSFYGVNHGGCLSNSRQGWGQLPPNIPFIGYHSAGDQYPEASFVSSGSYQFSYIQTADGDPVIKVHPMTHKPDDDAISKAKEYAAMVEKVEAKWKAKE